MKVEYVWLGGDNEFRSKVRTLSEGDGMLEWNYDGSSTNQADGKSSEVILKPCRRYDSPILGTFFLCTTYSTDDNALSNNHRVKAAHIFTKHKGQKPWFGLEQEYFIWKDGLIINSDAGGVDNGTEYERRNYCGVGQHMRLGRRIADDHYNICRAAGITISGYNAEVAGGQWEFQIGPAEGITAGDDLMMARFLLHRVAERYECNVTFEPKPMAGVNGSGCHTNFSTKDMRSGYRTPLPYGPDYGVSAVDVVIKRLEKSYLTSEIYRVINTDKNRDRLTGSNETARYDTFTCGVGDRTATVRIPRNTSRDGKGYIELRTPPSDCDPYQITSLLTQIACEMV